MHLTYTQLGKEETFRYISFARENKEKILSIVNSYLSTNKTFNDNKTLNYLINDINYISVTKFMKERTLKELTINLVFLIGKIYSFPEKYQFQEKQLSIIEQLRNTRAQINQ